MFVLKITVTHSTNNGKEGLSQQSPPQRVSTQGKKSTTKSVQSSLQLACDMFVACYMEKYKEEEPQIGKIVAVHEASQKLDVEWMTGAYDDKWSVCKRMVGRRKVPWVETIHRSSVLFPVEFTFYMRLKKEFITKLKETYKNIQ